MVRATVKIAADSERSMPSCTQTFGYTAVSPAAINPTRLLTISRPARPTTTMVPVPSTQVQIMWTSCVGWWFGHTSEGSASQSR